MIDENDERSEEIKKEQEKLRREKTEKMLYKQKQYLDELLKKKKKKEEKDENYKKKQEKLKEKLRETIFQNKEIKATKFDQLTQPIMHLENIDKKKSEHKKSKIETIIVDKDFLERMAIVKKPSNLPPINDWVLFRKRYKIPDDQKIFVMKGG